LKCLGINLANEEKDLNSEDYTAMKKKLKTLEEGDKPHAHGLAEFMLQA
jgi:hypothetical protein